LFAAWAGRPGVFASPIGQGGRRCLPPG